MNAHVGAPSGATLSRRSRRSALLPALLLGASMASAQEPAAPAETAARQPAWIVKSNAEAQVLLDTYTRFYPEMAGQLGVAGLDNRVSDLGLALSDRIQAAFTAAARELDERRAVVTDPRVVQDLEILRQDALLQAATEEANQRYLLPSFDVAERVYNGVRALLTDQVAPERRPSAAVRLRRYAGLEEGYAPIAVQAEARVRDQLGTLGLLFPLRDELEQQLANSSLYLDGVQELLDQYKVKDGDKALKELRVQVAAYDDFLRREVLPRAREDFRLPADLYAVRLREVGVDLPPAELAARARTAFMEIRNQMIALAPVVARDLKLEASDYPGVIRELRSRQVTGEATLPLYRERLAVIEDIIRTQKIVTLPRRKAIIRLATAAESASVPSPQMKPPPFVNNQGEQGQFVLPLAMPPAEGEASPRRLEDFTFDAVTWTLTAHEARPGHELQFASMVENGVSLARALFAFNSVNVEGWALYAEAETQPYLPLDGQLIALQFRLLRAARAFLDPGLQQGVVTLDEARRILVEEVVLTEAFAEQELQRYTFRAPGQATSYFYGYQRLLDLRASTEVALGRRFDRQRFHDFVLAQGVLPPALLARLIQDNFIPAELKRK
ncbi:MAG: DUF885 domain-containing protein [Gammaproteobacteria bacterium]|nr:DUF885 domain-containing protein [Gammaproteobacteria bacterium]